MSRRSEILSKIETVPAMPPMATKTAELLQEENVGLDDILPLVEHDAGLTANLLRACNSPLYRGHSEVDSLRDAIVRLGTRKTLELALTQTTAPIAGQALQGYDLPPGRLWEHSVAVAVGAEELAKALGLEMPRYTFTAALLHDLGKIVLGTFVEVDGGPILQLASRDSISFEEAEEVILGINHAEVGALLLENWNLPSSVVEVVRWHHRPEQLSGDTRAVDLVHAANLMALEGGFGSGIEGLNCRASEHVVARLRLSNRTLETVLCAVIDELDVIRTLFGE